MLVSIIIPAYKKEKTIVEDIDNIYSTMKSTRWEFELIVVVDGFLDKTYEIAKTLEKTHRKVKVFGYKKNYGKGYAVRYGMSRASGDLIAFLDSGMDINPNGISMLLEHMLWYDADIVVASKRHAASKVKYYSKMRKLYSWGYFLLTKTLFGLRLKDTQTGLKIYKKEVLEKVLPRLVVKEFAFDIEVLAVANYLGFTKIYEAPVELKIEFEETSKWSAARPLFLDKNVRKMLVDTLGIFFRLKILDFYSDTAKRVTSFDTDLQMHLNTGELKDNALAAKFLYLKDSINEKIYPEKKFSIIIPVRQINDFLKESITYLKKLEYQNFEVIIILDTYEPYDFKGDFRFKIYGVGALGPGEKRNIGVAKATGEIVAFLDDDAYPKSDWLINANKIFNKKDIYALGGPAQTPKNDNILRQGSGRVHESFLTSAGEVFRHIPQKPRMIYDYPTVNLFVTKKAFDEVGGFNTEFWPGEDTEFCLRLVTKYDRGFYYDPSVIVYHHRRELFCASFKASF